MTKMNWNRFGHYQGKDPVFHDEGVRVCRSPLPTTQPTDSILRQREHDAEAKMKRMSPKQRKRFLAKREERDRR